MKARYVDKKAKARLQKWKNVKEQFADAWVTSNLQKITWWNFLSFLASFSAQFSHVARYTPALSPKNLHQKIL
ncbi:MAG: hypothetical protein NC342_06490, partial [Pseudoflavonifractor sp.]|nr:hypothetical protein [Alloprevotella sp.]MCM1117167.1 hypothetical protein [Pseudoflavonifractor sp.]